MSMMHTKKVHDLKLFNETRVQKSASQPQSGIVLILHMNYIVSESLQKKAEVLIVFLEAFTTGWLKLESFNDLVPTQAPEKKIGALCFPSRDPRDHPDIPTWFFPIAL